MEHHVDSHRDVDPLQLGDFLVWVDSLEDQTKLVSLCLLESLETSTGRVHQLHPGLAVASACHSNVARGCHRLPKQDPETY